MVVGIDADQNMIADAGNPVMLDFRQTFRMDFQGNLIEKTETFWFLALMNRPNCTNDDILGDARVPKLYTRTHPTDGNMFLVDYKIDQNPEVPQVYNVGLVYSNTFKNEDGQKGQGPIAITPVPNPLQREAVITWNTYRTRKVWEKDLDEKPFTTTAGEPIIHEGEVTRRVISIKKNVGGMNVIFAKKGDFVNRDTVVIQGITFEPDTLWMTDITLGPVDRSNGYMFFEMSFNLFHNPDTWYVYKRNAGWCAFVPTMVRSANNPLDIRYTQYESQLRYGRIKIGNPEHYPSTVLPIRNTPDNPATNGTLFPEFVTVDPVTKVPKVADPNAVMLDAARQREIWDEAKLKFRCMERINFTGLVPLR